MDFSDITDVIADNPWTAAAGVIALLLLMRSNDSAPQGVDYSATLASMDIASRTNVDLASIQAQRDAVHLSAQRDIALGAQQYAIADRQAALTMAITGMQAASLAGETASDNAVVAYQSTLGYNTARAELAVQEKGLDIMQRLGLMELGANRELGGMSITAGKEVALEELGIGREIGIKTIDSEIEAYKFGLPFTERMHLQEQETIRNLAWRQKQIAKLQSKYNLFGGLIDGGFGLLSQGLGTFGGAK